MRSALPMRGAPGRIFLISCVLIPLVSWATAQTPGAELRPPDVQEVLSWLPSDTETVIVANRPPVLSGLLDFQRPPELFTKEVAFALMPLTPLWLKNGSLNGYLKDQTATLVLQGSREFRLPTGFGPMHFQGCTIIVLANDFSELWNLFLRGSSADALKVEEIEGQKILVFREQLPDGPVWTTFVGLPKPNILIVGTDFEYVREMLSRMRGNAGPRALPESLSEWKYLDATAQFWGLRHYDRAQAKGDPSSPIGDREIGEAYNDKQAIGLVFSFDAAKGKGPSITYLSGNDRLSDEPERGILSMGYEGGKLGITYRKLGPGVVEASYNVEAAGAIFIFSFFLGWMLGHGVSV